MKLQKELFKTEMDHVEVDGNNYKDKKHQWLVSVRQDVFCTALVMQDIVKMWKKSPDSR